MRLSTKGRYAVTAMMHLAIHDKYGPVTLAEISQCQGISLSEPGTVVRQAAQTGAGRSARSRVALVAPARSPEQVTVADIIGAADERLDTTRCLGHENCQEGRRCLTHEL